MNKNDRDALRAAVLIREQLAKRNLPASIVHLSGYSWATIERLQHQIARASGRGWHRAARRLSQEMADALRRYHQDLEMALRTVEAHNVPRISSTPAEIYRDIQALQTEFDEVEIDIANQTISVTTDTIEFEGIDLGQFEIRLDWHRLGSSLAYRLVARDPNPAATNSEVTHPHVQDETLCEGEGHCAIQAALAQGRIYDFMLLVSQVLHTYARGSAYVEMHDWTGVTCSDCGTMMSPDDSYSCQRCGCELCDDCHRLCAACEECYCSGCLSCCPECEMDFCRGCLDECPECGRDVCGNCMEDGLCSSCQAKQIQEEEENHDDNDESTTEGQPADRAGIGTPCRKAHPAENLAAADEKEPGTAAESDRLGEAFVPA